MSRPRLLVGVICLLALESVFAAEAQYTDELRELDSASVVMDGATLFRVAGSPSFPAAERARQVGARIETVARDREISPADVTATQSDGRIEIVARGRRIVVVADSDAALEGLSRADVAQVRVVRIRDAIARFRAERQPDALVRSFGWAIAATIVAFAGVLLIMRVFRRLSDALDQRYRQRLHSLTIQSFEIVQAATLWRGVLGVMSGLRAALIAALAYIYLRVTLSAFPWTRSAADGLGEAIGEPLATAASAVLHYIPKLVFLVVLAIGVRWALRLLRLFFDAVGAGRVPLRSFDAEWAQPTHHIVRILVVLLALVVAYPYLPGSGSAAFQGLSIFAGLMLSLGASSAMASVIAGYTVTYRRAFRVGDRISVGEFMGEVSDVRLMATHLRTVKNEEIVVPNSLVLQSHVVNYSKLAATQGLIVHTKVAIGYQIPWRQVEAMLLLAAGRTAGLLREPAPFVLETALGDFAVGYELNAYVDSAANLPQRYADLHRNVLDVFNEYGVQIMTPAYEGDPERPKIVAQDRWYDAPARKPENEATPQNMNVANASAPP